MTRSMPALLLIVVIAALGTVPDAARADSCGSSCATAKRICRAEALSAVRACAQLCRASDSLLACRQGCRAAFLAAKTTCVTALQDCRTSCPPPGACATGCAQDLRACLAAVGTHTCAQTCYMTARTAAMACRTSPNPFRCLIDIGSQLGGCLQGCASGSHSGAEACFTTARSCLQGCQGGSPSGAFLEASASPLR